ncbi:MAG TPA: LytTR family DNA-binding domain-containing protein [Puia sp.]|nr:LytTR family DNA-binding domain-containing protein [Puia sp.]
MLSAIAIDDEPLALEVIRNFTAQVPFIRLAAGFTKATDALGYLQKEKADLLFLDIRMPDITGIDFMRSLHNLPMVIFTTAYSEHAVQCFELDAVDYLLKPFSLVRFLKACNKAVDLHAMKQSRPVASPQPSTVFIKSGYEQVRVMLDDIRYVESLGNYVQFILADQKIISRLTMNEAAELLPGDVFIRIHRSYLAAKNKITKIDKRTVWLGDTELPAGEAFYPDIEKCLNNK